MNLTVASSFRSGDPSPRRPPPTSLQEGASALSGLPLEAMPFWARPLTKKAGAVDAELVGGVFAAGADVVEELLVGQASLEALLGEADLFGQLRQGIDRIVGADPIRLLFVEQRHHVEILVLLKQRTSIETAAASGSSGNSR